MVGSSNKKFIFFHLYKVAGTSIRGAFNKYQEFNKLPSHINPKEFRNKGYKMKMLYDEYFTFSFVRNPWDWQVSLYHYMLQTPYHFQHQIIKNMKSFDEYIDWRVNEDFSTQYSFLSENGDNKSEITLDFVGKFETINDDFNFVKKHLGLDGDLPHSNKSNRSFYKEYYTETSRKMIEEAAKKDIEFFGYDYDNLNIVSGEETFKHN